MRNLSRFTRCTTISFRFTKLFAAPSRWLPEYNPLWELEDMVKWLEDWENGTGLSSTNTLSLNERPGQR